MIVIDTKRNKAYGNLNKTQAGKLVGVNRRTILAWSKRGKVEHYNRYVIYFDAEILKKGMEAE